MDEIPKIKILFASGHELTENEPDLRVLENILKSSHAVCYAKTGRDALESVDIHKPDLILLDASISDMNGFEVFSALKKSCGTRDIPVLIMMGQNSVKEAINNNTAKDNASFLVKTKKEIRPIFHRELLFVEGADHWIHFHLSDGSQVKIYATLKEYREILFTDPRFARCHGSYIVNMDYVRVIETDRVILKNDACLPVSKNWKSFKKQYFEWMRRHEAES